MATRLYQQAGGQTRTAVRPVVVTVAMAARMLATTRGDVRYRLRSGQLEGELDDGGRWLVSLPSLDRFAAMRERRR